MEHYDYQYTTANRGNELNNLQLMLQDKLQKTEEENRQLHWALEGMKRFSMLMADHAADKKAFYCELTGFMVRYVKAGYGNLYMLHHTPDCYNIEITEHYTYGYKKNEKMIPDISEEGLIWQAVKQVSTICTTHVPASYTPILIGLLGGTALPKSLIALPLLIGAQLYGVVEIASLRTFESYEITLLEKMAECMTMTIPSERLFEQTKNILLESQIKSRELLDRYKKMQQDIKELRRTQRQILSLQSVIGSDGNYRLYLN